MCYHMIFQATNSDELSFVEQEELELINEGDGDGWVMVIVHVSQFPILF